MSDLTKRAVLSDSFFNQRTAALNLINGISPIKSTVCRQLVNDDSWSPVKSPARKRNLRKDNISGFPKCRDLSFEHNQSFPLMKPHHREDFLGFVSPRMTMDKIRGDSLNSCRFSAGRRRCSFSSMKPLSDAPSGAVDHLLPSEASTASATLCASVSTSQPQAFHKTVMLNPNKAVFTFDFKSMKILVVNQMACRLLGFSPDELCGLTLVQLLNRQHAHTPYALSEEHLDTTHGTTLGVSGKVVEMISKDGAIIPVSLWLRRLQMDDRCLAVAEPVERRVAKLEVDAYGRILWMDQDATQLFQYTIEEVEGEDIKLLIPAFLMPAHPDSLPKEVRKQKATGRTKYGTCFPLCLRLSEELDEGSGDSSVAAITYSVILWVFSNMSGLLVLTPDGNVEQCNHHFTHIMFGHTQAQLCGKHITTVIPNFTHDPVCNGDDSILPPFQLGEELAENALNTDSTTPQAWRSNNDTDSQSTNRIDTESHSTNIFSLDNSNHTDCRKLIESVSQLSDLTNKISLHDDETTSAGVTLQNDVTLGQNYKMFSCASDTLSIDQKENNPPDDGSDPLVTADNTTCEEFSRSEDDTLNGNKNKNNKLVKPYPRNSQSPTVSVELSSCVGVTSSSMCTCTSHPSRYSHSEVDDNTLSVSSISHVKPPAPSPVTLPDVKGSFPEGHFIGFGKHRDGSNIEIVYQVRMVQLRCGRQLYCVWISRDCEEEDPMYGNLTFTSSLESSAIEPSLGQEIQARAQSASRPSSLSIMTQCEDELLIGEYGERYTTLQQIGKGAYGFVKMAYRNDDNILVITKFIHKKKVHEQSWVEDPIIGKRVPLEVSLLTTIKHPNIVRILDVFENETFFQMVMEKHGAGMDLFEFVDRRPKLDEPLISYIFRQIVAAVQYLHSLKILHRDIKDENVIIDQNFHAKLIDFGSATFMSSDRLFSTFYGTVEYCSPEVLAGNKYEGPELEIWSLGVTLYVLTFGENPFFDVEETLKAELRPPGTASPQLLGLLHAMLERNPSMRLNMQQLCAHLWINQHVDPSQYRFQEVVNCMPHEYDPPTFYADYQQSRPMSRSRDYLMPPVTNSVCGDDDDDRTDLATSNSLTSLTPVDETVGQFPCSSGFVELKKHQLLNDDLNEGLASSTPLKPKKSVSPVFVAPQAAEKNGSDPSDVNTKSSSSISLVRSSSSSSFERSVSSMTVSMNRKENDSLAQHLLDGNSLDGNFSCGGLLTDEEDYLNDDFEEERGSEYEEILIGNSGVVTLANGDDRDADTHDNDESDDNNDVNCGSCDNEEGCTLEEE